jgi:hypothetical protein
MNRLFVAVIFSVGLLIGGASSGFAFVYSEAIDGELDGQYIGCLGLGANTVTGEVGVSLLGYDPTTLLPLPYEDLDTFEFQIASGMILSSVFMSYSVTYIDNGDQQMDGSALWGIQELALETTGPGDPPAEPDYISQDMLEGSGELELYSDLNLGAGTYTFGNFGWSLMGYDAWYSAYNLTFTVESASPVPIPSTMFLLGSGIVGIVGTSRMKLKR